MEISTQKLTNICSPNDYQCSICLELLIKPVTMPCKHELCLQCFETHVYNTSLSCPLCRLRISTWVRKNTKTKTLVNEDRWELIQKLFPTQVKRKLEGDDEDDCFLEPPVHIIANEGELRREYEEEMKKIMAENNREVDKSMDYIKTMEVLEEERIKQMKADEAAAQALQMEEMNNLGVTLTSPSRHQQQILEMLRPKSPMLLRSKKRPIMSNNKRNHKRPSLTSSSTLVSPSRNIKSFFQSPPSNKKYSNDSDTQSCSRPSFTDPQISTISSDHELAKKLQESFDVELVDTTKPLTNKKPMVELLPTQAQADDSADTKQCRISMKKTDNLKLTAQSCTTSSKKLSVRNKNIFKSKVLSNYIKVTRLTCSDKNFPPQVSDENSPIAIDL